MKTKKKVPLWPVFVVGVLGLAAALWLVFRPAGDAARRIAGFWSSEGVRKPNVILFTLDTTRADHLACYGYPNVRTPNLDALARRGVLFEHAASASPLTLPSHSTIMTGMYPTHHGVRVNGNTALGDEQTTLAEVFAGQGYETGAFIAAFVLDGRWGLKQGFAHYDDRFDLKKYKHIDLGAVQRPGNEIMDAALTWLDEKKGRPFFTWIHLYDPHMPYAPPEPYRTEYGARGPIGLYDGEIAFMDEQIGRCVAWLDKNGLDKSTVILLVGDHGEGLGSHGEGSHGYYIYDYATHVPLIISSPFAAIQGKRVASQVRTVDVFPTLLDMAGLSDPVKPEGKSLAPLLFHPEEESGEPAYSESMSPNLQFGWGALHSLRTLRYKYIDAPRPELYDVSTDPEESVNLLPQSQDIARKMKADLDRLMAESSVGAPAPQAANLDKETMERLTALGYVGGPVSSKKASAPGETLPDPKDKLLVFNAVTRAGELFVNNQYKEAAEGLEAALKNEPIIPQAMLVLATCYDELGRREEAKATLDALLKAEPESVQGLIVLANILLEEKKDDDVLALCKQALAVDERNNSALSLIGQVYMGRLQYAEALPYIERAVDVQPKVARDRLNLAACLVGLDQYERAETLLKGVISESPKFPLAHYNLGLLYEEQGKLDEARDEYTQEVTNYPAEFKAHFNRGKLLFKLGDRAGSLAEMRQVVKLAPKLAEGRLMLARGLLYEAVSLDEVQSEVQAGLSLAETNELKALGYYLLADVYNRRHDPQKVAEALKNAEYYKSRKE